MLTKEEWKKRKVIKHYIRLGSVLTLILLAFIFICIGIGKLVGKAVDTSTPDKLGGVAVTGMLLTPNEYSRPQLELEEVKGIVIHQSETVGASAVAVRNSYEELRISKSNHESVHLIIGLDGEIVQCIPLNEVAYASKDRNNDTISIEVCCYNESGQFNAKTYETLVAALANLCDEFDLKPDDVIRHYDVTGVECPGYYVNNEDSWLKLKSDVKAFMD